MKIKSTALHGAKQAPMVQVKAGPADDLAEGEFTAYASVFDVKDSYGDVIRKGAFGDSLGEWQKSGNVIPLLFGHNMSDPDYNIGEVLEAKEDDHGLWVHGRLDLENPKAAQTYRLLKGRRLSQLSFAYDVLEGSLAKSEDLGEFYELTKLKVYEVSLVPIGANQETEVLSVKAAAEALLAKAGRTLSAKNENALKSVQSQLADAAKALGEVLASVSTDDQEKASEPEPAKTDEPEGAKADEPTPSESVDAFLAAINIKRKGLGA